MREWNYKISDNSIVITHDTYKISIPKDYIKDLGNVIKELLHMQITGKCIKNAVIKRGMCEYYAFNEGGLASYGPCFSFRFEQPVKYGSSYVTYYIDTCHIAPIYILIKEMI